MSFKEKRDLFVTLIFKHPQLLVHSCRIEGNQLWDSAIIETEAPKREALLLLEQRLEICDRSYKERLRKSYFVELS